MRTGYCRTPWLRGIAVVVVIGSLFAILLAVSGSSAGQAKDPAPTVTSPDTLADEPQPLAYFQGSWTCEGVFPSSGKPIASIWIFHPNWKEHGSQFRPTMFRRIAFTRESCGAMTRTRNGSEILFLTISAERDFSLLRVGMATSSFGPETRLQTRTRRRSVSFFKSHRAKNLWFRGKCENHRRTGP